MVLTSSLSSTRQALCQPSCSWKVRSRPFAGTQIPLLRPQRARRTAGLGSRQIVCVADVDESNFKEEVLQAELPVLVDFWANWCGPCKLISPLMDKIEQEFDGALKVVKINADPCPNLVEKYKVYGLPTIILFKDGEVVSGSQKEGAITPAQLYSYLEKYSIATAVKS